MNEENNTPNFEELLGNFGMNQRFQEEFLSKRRIFLWGPVHDESAKKIVDQLLYLESLDSGRPIEFFINSPGGVVTSGMIIYDTMKMISSPVSTICIGMAASMGSILLSGGEKGKRTIWPSGKVMIHQPSIGGVMRGSASDLKIQADQIQKTKELGAKILAENCGKSVEQILADFDRDFWLNAQESVSYGIVDEITNKISF